MIEISNQSSYVSQKDAQNPFCASLHELVDRSQYVPDGWQPAYKATLEALHATRCESREGLVLHGPNVRAFDLEISSPQRDHVVDRILRKLRDRTCRTCENCGRAGISQADIVKTQVICGTCAAPWLMRERIREFTELVEASVLSELGGIWSFEQVPI